MSMLKLATTRVGTTT